MRAASRPRTLGHGLQLRLARLAVQGEAVLLGDAGGGVHDPGQGAVGVRVGVGVNESGSKQGQQG